MGSQVTFRKIRKTVHKVMLKYGKRRFYRKIDWIDKVLHKLRVKSTLNMKAKIRNHINKWLKDNSEVLNVNEADNKKGLLDSKITENSTDQSIEKKNQGISNVNNLENQQQSKNQEREDNSSNLKIPPMPEGISIKKLKEKLKEERIPVIDLASEDEKKVKKNKVEVITIDDDIQIIDENVLPQQQPSVNLPEQYYVIPDYSYNDYCQNDYLFYPVILQHHSVDSANC